MQDPERESQLFFWLVTNKTIPKKSKLANYLVERRPWLVWRASNYFESEFSSADGYFLEAGPLRFVNGALTLNKAGWHEFANVLFLDQPVGTGFSITSKQMLGSLDEITEHFVSFMKAFYTVFPERVHDDVYIAGESYAGTYIPYFSKAILERNDNLQSGEQAINLQGSIIGNGWTDPLHQYSAYIPFVQKYKISTPAMLERMENQMNYCMDAIRLQDRITQDPCERLVEIVMEGSMTGDANNPKCLNQYDIRLYEDYPSCGGTWPHELPLMKQYLDRADVRLALHATAAKNEWSECNHLVSSALRFDDSLPAVALLPYVLSKTKVLLYSGQQDFICNHLGTEYMISNLTWDGARGFQDVPTVGWTVEDKPAGEWQTQRNLSYVLIYNSSHMVPYDVPLVTLDMINRFIGIDHRLQSFPSRLETDPVDDLPPMGGKQDVQQEKSSYSSVNGAAVLILTMIAVCIALFVIVRNNRRQKKLGGDGAQWFPLNRHGNTHTDELDELVLESGIRESMDDTEEDEDEGSDRRDDERDSLDNSQDEDFEQKRYRRGAGANVYHAGKIGKDGEWVRKIMQDSGVDTSYVKVSEKEATGRAIIQLSQESHDNSIVLFPGTNHTVSLEEARHVLSHFGEGDWLVMQNEISSGGEIMRAAKERGLTICFNPSPFTNELPKEYPLHLVDYLLINEIEAQGLYSYLTAPKSDTDSVSSSSHITASESFPVLEKAYEQISGIIITLGGDGLVARFRINEEDVQMKEFRMGIVKGHVVNTTGAGDTFAGYFVANLVRNQELNKRFSPEQLRAALEEASHAASLAVSREGAMDSIPVKLDVDEAIRVKEKLD
ncbi:Cell death protease [Haplosporangium bisporale]|nr:Cell death protease [Haplosporangium bisporale]